MKNGKEDMALKFSQYPKMLFKMLKDMKNFSHFYQFYFLRNMDKGILQTQYAPPPITTKHKIIISLTTHITRINYVHYVLDSLYTQTLQPHEAHLYLTEGEYHVLPSVLRRFEPWLKIFETQNIGSYKKIIPALLKLNQDEVLISVDDDFIYPSYLVYSLYSLFLEHQDALICFNGKNHHQDTCGGVIGGLGVLYNQDIFNINHMKGFFDKRIFWEEMGYKSLDDIWTASWCFERNIPIRSIDERNFSKNLFRSDFCPLPSCVDEALTCKNGKHGKLYMKTEEMRQLQLKMQQLIKEY